MGRLLQVLILLMTILCIIIVAHAKDVIHLPFGHIQMAIPFYLFFIFGQAIIMFYFIGVHRLHVNVFEQLMSMPKKDQPDNIHEYESLLKRMIQKGQLLKRKVIPWTMLIITLATLSFLMGGAHDTGLVAKKVHLGLVYGLILSMILGHFAQFKHLGSAHIILKKLKAQFDIPNKSM